MADSSRPTATVQELADLVGGTVHGDGSVTASDLAPVFQAGPGELGLLSDHRYLDEAPSSRAGALLVASDLLDRVEAPQVSALLVVERPREALVALLEFFHPPEEHTATIHPTAVLGRGVRLEDGVSIGPYAVLEDGVVVGAGSRIGAHCSVGSMVVIGQDCRLFPRVTLYDGVVLGNRVAIHAGACLGADGFGYVFENGAHRKIPQVGACVLEDDVEVGANACIDRGSIGRTVIGEGAKIDNLAQIGHNVTIGAFSIISAHVGMAGSARIGQRVTMAGQVGVGGHVKVGDGATVAGQSGITDDLPVGKATYWGTPAVDYTQQKRSLVIFQKLPELSKRVRALEKRLDASEE